MTVQPSGLMRLMTAMVMASSGIYADLSIQEQQMILRKHNALRRQSAKGQTADHAGKLQPQAANMIQLDWNETMATAAQHFAASCGQKGNVGLNEYQLEAMWTTSDNKTIGIDKAINNWFWEINPSKMTMMSQGKGVFPGSYEDYMGTVDRIAWNFIGHYTQMVWAKTSDLGCGFATGCAEVNYGGDSYLVCRYSPRGNTRPGSVYKVGEPCSKCDAGHPHCNDALCSVTNEFGVTNSRDDDEMKVTPTTATTSTIQPTETTNISTEEMQTNAIEYDLETNYSQAESEKETTETPDEPTETNDSAKIAKYKSRGLHDFENSEMHDRVGNTSKQSSTKSAVQSTNISINPLIPAEVSSEMPPGSNTESARDTKENVSDDYVRSQVTVETATTETESFEAALNVTAKTATDFENGQQTNVTTTQPSLWSLVKSTLSDKLTGAEEAIEYLLGIEQAATTHSSDDVTKDDNATLDATDSDLAETTTEFSDVSNKEDHPTATPSLVRKMSTTSAAPDVIISKSDRTSPVPIFSEKDAVKSRRPWFHLVVKFVNRKKYGGTKFAKEIQDPEEKRREIEKYHTLHKLKYGTDTMKSNENSNVEYEDVFIDLSKM